MMRRREFITLLGGAAAAWPLAARAQQADRMRRIGVLMGGAETDLESHPRMSALQQGLERLGWKVGRNLRIDYRWTMADLGRTRTGAEELLRLSPDVLLADGGTRASALLRATRTVPIVFVFAGDPVALGLVQSFARPGGNSSGFTVNEPTIGPKLLQFLMEIAPRVRRVAVVFNPATGPFSQQMMRLIDEAAPTFGVQMITSPAQEPGDIEAALARLGTDPGRGLLVPPDNYTTVHRKLILDLSLRYRLPTVYAFRYFVADGGLIAYGVDAIDPFGRAAGYIDRILRGEKPSDLPVQAPTKYELVINRKTAKALGINVPLTLPRAPTR
jgi:putative ABC transport system substrate-binding protein